jgi:hypothetical protein
MEDPVISDVAAGFAVVGRQGHLYANCGQSVTLIDVPTKIHVCFVTEDLTPRTQGVYK